MLGILTVDTFEKLCDQSWRKNEEIPDRSMVFCPMEGCYDFFKYVGSTNKRVVLVSAYSDYTLCYQNDFHPNSDLVKMLGRYKWDQFVKIRDKYIKPVIESAKYDNCHPKDRFIVKIDSFSEFTFAQLPSNIMLWLTTNCNVIEDRIRPIPFGVNEQGPGKDILPLYYKKEKTNLLYINFQDYTSQRIQLKDFHKEKNGDWARIDMETKVPVEEFYRRIADSLYVLCPFGNGFDQYRILECLTCGSIPIVQDSHFSRNLYQLGFPLLLCRDLFGITKEELEGMAPKYRELIQNETLFNREILTKKYWENALNFVRDEYNLGVRNVTLTKEEKENEQC